MKKLFTTLFILITLFFAVLVFISETKPSRQVISGNAVTVPEPVPGFEERLSKSIQIRTVSHEDREQNDTVAFSAFHNFLFENFPVVHKTLEPIKINRFGLIYFIQGKNPSLKPAMFTAHQDVVPVSDSTGWKHPPFSGFSDGTYIWGRGALDDKGSLLALLEAMELLLKHDFQPQRSLILAFGFDEEINGEFGAKAISEYLEKHEIHPEFVLDEGLVLTKGIVPMTDKPVGLVGIAEKGYLTLKLSAVMDGGHSSIPERENSLTVLAKAVTELQRHPFKSRWCEPVKLFMDYLGPEMDFFPRLVFNNRWFFSPAIQQVYHRFSEGQASIRTTTAPAIFHSGIKDNIIPQTSEAWVNFRILPGETVESVVKEAEKIVDDHRVSITIHGQAFSPPVPSSVTGFGFNTVLSSIAEQYPDAIAVPYLMPGSSDAKHYYNICSNIYRFTPYELSAEDMPMLHGSNERIRIDNYKRVIEFYYRMFLHSCN